MTARNRARRVADRALDRIVCIVNPARRRSRAAIASIRDHCEALGKPAPLILETTVEEPGAEQARKALESSADLVIVAGGDGTVRNVGSMLANSGVPMGIIPTGTANIFHLNAIGRSRSLQQSARRALLGVDVACDVGVVRYWQGHSDVSVETTFLVVVGVGRDALTLQRVSEPLKRKLGPAAYFAAGAREIARAAMPVSVTIDEEPLPIEQAWSVLVGNCGVVPGGITILPRASITDGELDVLHVLPPTLAHWIPIAAYGLTGQRRSPRGLVHRKATSVMIESPDPIAIQIDGDVVNSVRKMEITIEPSALIVRGMEARA